MTAEKIREVVRIYRQMFGDTGVRQHKFSPHHTPPYGFALQHCHAMLNEIDQFVLEGRIEKAFRWLGFVQGCLWTCGVYSLDELKNHNRP